MFNNPEFKRNIWLEITPQRIIALTSFILLLFAFYYFQGKSIDTAYYARQNIALQQQYEQQLENNSSGELIKPKPIEEPFFSKTGLAKINLISLALFFFITALWGSKQAGQSVSGEIFAKTWDNQRMSSLSPWSMTWGKIFGSTIFQWYGGLICLTAFLLTMHLDYITTTPIKLFFMIIFSTLLAHSLNFLNSIVSPRKKKIKKESSASSFFFFIITCIILAGLIQAVTFNRYNNDTTLLWYNIEFTTVSFVLYTVMVLTFWSFLGSLRAMKEELQQKVTCLGWVGFVIFLIVYYCGFNNQEFSIKIIISWFIPSLLTILLVLLEIKDPIQFKKLLINIKSLDIKSFLYNTPLWIPTFLITTIAAIIALIMHSETVAFLNDVYTEYFIVASYLFFVRDIAFILFLNLAKNNKRADMIAIAYLVILYLLVPGILNFIYSDLVVLFFPKNDPISIVSALVQVTVILYLVRKRWFKYHA